MKLALSMIAACLKDYKLNYHLKEDEATIQGIRFLSDQEMKSSLNYVYIGKADTFFADTLYQDAYLLVCGQNQLIVHTSDYGQLLNDILAAFESYNRAEQKLVLAAASHKPLEDMIEELSLLLPGCFMIYDIDGNRLCRSGKLPASMAKERKKSIDSDNISAFILDTIFYDDHGKVLHDLKDYPSMSFDSSDLTNGCVAMYLTVEKRKIGFLLYFPESDQENQAALRILGLLAGYLPQAAQYQGPDSLHLSDQAAFRYLLEGQTLNEQLLKELSMRLLKKEGDKLISLTLVLFHSRIIRNYTARNGLLKYLESIIPVNISCEYDQYVVILIKSRDFDMLILKINSYTSMGNADIAVSMPIIGLSDLHKALRQCLLTLHQSTGSGIHSCMEHALSHQLRLLKEQDSAMFLLHPMIDILKAHDKLHHSDLYDTLCSYLVCNLNQALTARQMHIHLNTLKYRLKKICEVAGYDIFADHKEVFHMELSIRLTQE